MEGPRHHHSALAAAHIINILSMDVPPAIKYSKILHCILDAMYEAEAELKRIHEQVSNN